MAGRMQVSTIFRAVDKVTRPMRRMTSAVVKGGAKMGRALVKLTKLAGKLGRGLLGAAGSAAKLGGGTLAAGLTAVTMLNKSTVQAGMLSKAVNVSVDTMEALTSAIKPAGFEMDHVVDLVEEMNNKFGESAGLEQTLPVQEALTMLGLKFEELRKMKPEEQFKRVSDAILNLKDDAQAVSAADILFGGEANKVFGVLRATGKDFDGLINRYKELNFQTDESRSGAGAFVRQLGRVTTLISTMARFIAGLVGDALAPMIEKWAEWVIQNKDLIRSKVVEFVARLPAILDEISAGASKAFAVMSTWGAFFEQLGSIAGPVMRGIRDTFIAVGTAIGTTIGAIVVGIDKLLDRLRTAIEWAKGLSNVVNDVFFDGDDASGTRNGSGRGFRPQTSSPQERTANLLEERRINNTTEVVLRDSTGRAEVRSGGNNPGFSMPATGAF